MPHVISAVRRLRLKLTLSFVRNLIIFKGDLYEKNTLFLVVIFTLALTAGVSAQTAKEKLNAESAIIKHIKKEAKSGDAVEFPNARKIIFGDVDSDGDTDAVVLYSLEGFGGGMDWNQNLAVFLNKKGLFSFLVESVVGGKYEGRIVTLLNIKNGRIGLDSYSCGETNPNLCENPKKKSVYFYLISSKLKEGK